VREVRVTFTVTDNEDEGKEMSNSGLVEVWQEFLEETITDDYDMEDIKVEKVEELDRQESGTTDEEEEG
jgi:hypothetical protein